ncbi:alpha/beta fold hydrolase [Streptomyces sp. NPDC026206]|uniref:thioesterase II family protein n=1 Tax=Streptomyces sp. NPDC026206 TaxID=3157089 RepID=UPI00340D62E2
MPRTLLCLSFCGGGTSPFRPWARTLPDDVELVVHCYPGRESRYHEPFARTWDQLVSDALTTVRAVGDGSYVLLGHSMGAWVAFDLTRRLEEGAGRPPSALVVSAADAPSRWAAERDLPPTTRNTDEELLAWMSAAGQLPAVLLADPDMRQIAVEIFRADLRAAESYRYRPGRTVRTPLQVFYGEEDEVDAAAAERWRPMAAGGFEVERLPGGHFYTPGVWAGLPERLTGLRPRASA